ncbi:hypothetical protein COCCADRAFT_92626, partial [Bipolaris zeicola 26-R-13]
FAGNCPSIGRCRHVLLVCSQRPACDHRVSGPHTCKGPQPHCRDRNFVCTNPSHVHCGRVS